MDPFTPAPCNGASYSGVLLNRARRSYHLMNTKFNNCVFIVLCPLKQSVQNEIVTLRTATKQEDADKSASTLKIIFYTDPSLSEDKLFCDLHLLQ